MPPIFLARNEEQKTFKQILDSLLPPAQTDAESPSIFLLYGEGGMGKTTLLKRLREIAAEWQPYEGNFNLVFIDWEVERGIVRDLQIGHDNIRPETVIAILHDQLLKVLRGVKFAEYDRINETLKEADAAIDRELKSKPESELYSQLRKWGAKGIALMIRGGIAYVSGNPLETFKMLPQEPIEAGVRGVADTAALMVDQARVFAQNVLTPDDFRIYERPHEHLAEALGKGIREAARRKPIIMIMDTYEIIDRAECDYSFREVLKASGAKTVWVIGGRANLAESSRRGIEYFRGYRQDFEDYLYARSLSEFGLKDIQKYFKEVAVTRSLSSEDAEEIAKFTLGIPFAVSAAAVMWRDGVQLEEIVAPVSSDDAHKKSHERIIKQICERFLVLCVDADQRDREAIYALALMRRPEAHVLSAMLKVNDPDAALQSLHERYSFIWVDEMQLDDKVEGFLKEYLLADVRRKSAPVQQLNQRAISLLQERIGAATKEMPSAEERINNDSIAEMLSDLTHHLFWKSEEDGWHYLIPRFVEGLEYDINWAKGLLEIAGSFGATLSQNGQLRLKILSTGVQDVI